jgi:hypothetical protein
MSFSRPFVYALATTGLTAMLVGCGMNGISTLKKPFAVTISE